MRIELPFPPSSNTAYPSNARGRRHLSEKGKAWKEEAAWLIKRAVGGAKIPKCFCLRIALWMPTPSRRDVDNYVKLPKDVLCEVLGIDDDCNVIPRIVVEYHGVRAGGLCVIEIEAVGDNQGSEV